MALFMTLVPAYVNTLLHVQNLVLAGGVTFVIFAASSVTQLAFNGIDSKKSMSLGLILLVVGLGIFLVSVNLQFLSMLFIGILVVGVGQALSFLGSMAIVNQAAPPERRGDIVSGLYVWSYSGVGFPIIGVGFAAEHFGLYDTLIAFSGLVGAISLFLAFFILRNRNRLVVSKRC
jgi:MFS family permease